VWDCAAMMNAEFNCKRYWHIASYARMQES
jgi:hypothetical protein